MELQLTLMREVWSTEVLFGKRLPSEHQYRNGAAIFTRDGIPRATS